MSFLCALLILILSSTSMAQVFIPFVNYALCTSGPALFTTTGVSQTYTIPAGCTEMRIVAWVGGVGGGVNATGTAGTSGRVLLYLFR